MPFLDLVSILSNFNIVGSAIGISIGMAANDLIKSIAEGIILPLLSIFIKRGDLEGKVIKIGSINLQIGNLISNLIYFVLVVIIVILILKYLIGGLVQRIIDHKSQTNEELLRYEKQSANHLNALRNWNVPL